MTIAEYSKLKNNLDDLQRQYDRASGSLEQLKKELKDPIEIVEEKCKKEEKKLQVEEKKLEKDLEEFENKYGEKLK